MSPIHPEIFRVGKTSRWFTDSWNLNKSSALNASTIQTILQSYLGDLYNLFIVKCGIVDNSSLGVVEVSVIFYKYIQRARVVKTRRMSLLIAAGAFETKPPIYHVRLSQGFVIPAAMTARIESILQSIFGKPFSIQFFNISQLAEFNHNKTTERLIQGLDYFMRGKEKAVQRSQGKRSWPPLESRVEANWVNPIQLRNNYRPYKSVGNLAYFLDLLMITLYSSIYSLSDLMADVVVRGLLRNMKRHKQFIGAIQTVIEHFRSFDNWPYKPFDWCIGLHGKIGSGTNRSRSVYVKTGFLPLQTISFPLNYSYRQVDTKFGSIGIKVWLRRHSA